MYVECMVCNIISVLSPSWLLPFLQSFLFPRLFCRNLHIWSCNWCLSLLLLAETGADEAFLIKLWISCPSSCAGCRCEAVVVFVVLPRPQRLENNGLFKLIIFLSVKKLCCACAWFTAGGFGTKTAIPETAESPLVITCHFRLHKTVVIFSYHNLRLKHKIKYFF